MKTRPTASDASNGRPAGTRAPSVPGGDRLDDIAAVAAALGDRTRLRALLALRGGERCVCHIVEMLGLAPSTVSRHMSVLRAAGLAESRKRGRWVHYRLPGLGSSPVARAALAWALRHATGSGLAERDAARLRSILRRHSEGICRLTVRG